MAGGESALLIQASDRILLAGHRGMAGSANCRALQRKGYANLLTAGRQKLDLEDAAAAQAWFEVQRPGVVVLAAAKVGRIYANDIYPADYLPQNLEIQNKVIKSASGSGTRRLVFLGSSFIYLRDCPQPIK
jgi:GDP-L-fucose synthase